MGCVAAALPLRSQHLLAVALLYLLIMFRLEEFQEVVTCLPSKVVVIALSLAALAFFVLFISTLSLVLLLILVAAALRLQYYIIATAQQVRLFHARFFLARSLRSALPCHHLLFYRRHSICLFLFTHSDTLV
jgi:hypothetical protein